MPDLSVVILSYNTRDLLEQCLDALRQACAGIEFELIVVDNGSTDGSRSYLAGLGGEITLVLNDSNVGFAAANNVGMSLASAPVILLLNSDAFLTAESLEHALTFMCDQPEAGMAGVRILNPDGSVQAESGRFPSLWDDVCVSLGLDQLQTKPSDAPETAAPVDWVHGACMFVRTSAFERVGGLDSRFFMYSEEVDWCRRFWEAGWQVWYLPEAAVVHVGGASSRTHDLNRRIALYHSRLGLRRRLGGPLASALLWTALVVGFATRIAVRPLFETVARRRVGRQSAATDWQLLRAIARMDPLARFACT